MTSVLRGCGIATIEAAGTGDLTLCRSTEGVAFDRLRVGQKVSCQVSRQTNRVLQAQQETESMPLSSDTRAARQRLMTKQEFVAEYCRRWGVTWANISIYRVAVPAGDSVGWTMRNIDDHDDDQTVHSPLD